MHPVRSRPSSRWLLPGLLAALALALFCPSPARAALIVTASSASGDLGSSGNVLEVTLTNTGAPITNLDSFNVTLSVPAGSGITFTGADASTSLTYLLAGNSFGFADNVSGGGSIIDFSDLADVPPATIPAGSSGLGRVFFDVSAGAPLGPVVVTVSPNTTFTSTDFTEIPYTAVNGQVTVIDGATPVPEPSSIAVLGIGAVCLAGAAARRRLARRQA